MRFKDFKLLCDQKFGKISDEDLIKLLEKYDIDVEENGLFNIFPLPEQISESNNIEEKVNNEGRFKELQKIFKSLGFNLIAYSPSIFFEDTYVFETEEEAQKAFEKLEVELEVFQGWWNSKEFFINKVMKDYPHAEVIWAEL